ncbi:MAG TPA: fibronectin type III domain-containing protein, partial [Candidatus Dormibacteraeota bacterium]|nr:fibronectin type III domain-containing protein [Candidatus Dormibacteraeota bacterium]
MTVSQFAADEAMRVCSDGRPRVVFYAMLYDVEAGGMVTSIVTALLVVGSLAALPARVDSSTAGPAAAVAQRGGMTHAAPGISASAVQFSDMALDEAHGLLYGSDTEHGKVWVYTVSDLNIVAMIDVGSTSRPLGLDLSSDGSTLAVARSASGDIALLDTTSRMQTATLVPVVASGPNVPSVVRFGRTGRVYSAGSPGGDVIHVFDTTTDKEIAHSSTAVGANPDLAITADHSTIFDIEGAPSQPALVSFDVSTDTPTIIHAAASGSVQGSRVAIKPDGSTVYTSAGQVWSGDLQHLLGTINPAGSFVAYSPGIDRVFFTGTTPVTNQLTMASPSTFAILAQFLTADGSRTGVFRVNAAGSAAFVDENGQLETVNLLAPDSPRNLTARAGIGSTVVTWTPPLYGGTSAIAGYNVKELGGLTTTVPPTQTSVVLTGLSASVGHGYAVSAFNRFGEGTDSARTPFLNVQPGGTYHALIPARVLDTRSGGGPLGPGQTLPLPVTGQGGVPALVNGAGVSAVVLNVTVTDTTAASFLTVFPTGTALPTASSLNWVAG